MKDPGLESNSEPPSLEHWVRNELKRPLSDEELIDRARKHIPSQARKQRYAVRTPEEAREDANVNWDLTRALLRQIDTLANRLKWMKLQKLLLAGILGGAAAEGLKVIAVAIVKLAVR